MATENEKLELSESGFYKMNGEIYFIEKSGDMWKVPDFDKLKDQDLTEDAEDKRPPKAWWDACYKKIKAKNPDYTDEQIRGTCGMIYYKRGVRKIMDESKDFDENKNKNENLEEKEEQVYKSTYKHTSVPPEIKKNIESDYKMDKEQSLELQKDLTQQQYEENYWKETSKTKIDGSIAMKEARISKCQEVTGKSREECSNEVIKRMEKESTTDMVKNEKVKKKEIDEDEEDEDEEDEKKEDMKPTETKICIKRLDTLLEKEKKYDALQKEHNSLKQDFQEYSDWVKKAKEKEAKENEERRQDYIKKLSIDFDIPEEEIKDDSMEDLKKLEKRLDMSIKRNKEEREKETTEDFEEYLTIADAKAKELDERYHLKI